MDIETKTTNKEEINLSEDDVKLLAHIAFELSKKIINLMMEIVRDGINGTNNNVNTNT